MGSVGNTQGIQHLKNITNDDILVFQGGKESSISIEKDTKKYTVFRATQNRRTYRLDKNTGEVQASPYWDVIKDMYLKRK